MSKETLAFCIAMLCVAACCGYLFLSYYAVSDVPEFIIEGDEVSQAQTSFEIPEIEPPKADVKVEIPPIKREAPKVIPDKTPPLVDPSKDTIEKEGEDGGTVQTRDWESQKELPKDAEVSGVDEPPKYVNPAPQKQPPAEGTPKPGESKIINGQEYRWFEGFGWVKYGGSNVDIPGNTGELSGEKVGY